jgi:hypothetical protein
MITSKRKVTQVADVPHLSGLSAGRRPRLRWSYVLVAILAIAAIGSVGSPAEAQGYAVIPASAYHFGFPYHTGFWPGWRYRPLTVYSPYGFVGPYEYVAPTYPFSTLGYYPYAW